MDIDNSSHSVPPGQHCSPQGNNMRPLQGTDLTPRKPAQAGMSGPGRSVAKTRILVLEEHPLLRDGIADCFDSQPDMIVCGESDNISDARNKIAECKPQLLVTARRPGTGDSLEFVMALKVEKPGLVTRVYVALLAYILA